MNPPIGFLGGDHLYTVNTGATLNLAQVADDSGAGRSITKAGDGVLVLGTSGHTGNTTITGGTLSTASNTALGNGQRRS